MNGLLPIAGLVLAVVSSSYLLLGKWIVRPAPKAVAPGFVQAFHPCNRCAAVTRHLMHSPTCRRCQTCGNLTSPGDPS